MSDQNFIAVRAEKGTELARGVLHDDGPVEITLQGRLCGFPNLAAAERALESITTGRVRLVWVDE